VSVTLEDVDAAADTIRGSIVRTPSAVSETLSDVLGCVVVVKFENLQFVAAARALRARAANLACPARPRRC